MAKYVSGRQKNLKVGISSYSENLTSLEVIGNVGIATTNATSKLYVVGDGYFTGIVSASNFNFENSLVGAAGSFSRLNVSGITTLGVTSATNLTSQQLNVSGITTLGITSATNLTSQQLNVSGITTLGITSTTNLTSQQLNVSGITTLGVTSTTNLTSQQLNVSGITTLGITSSTNLTSQQLNVSGISTLGIVTSGNIYSTGIVTATQFSTGSGTLGFTTNTINGPSEIIIDPSPVGVGTTSGAVRIKGDLYVDGTQFIVNSTTIELADFNVGIATTVGTNALLDGAGIGIGSANIRKTFTYSSSPSDSLKSSENLDIASGKVYKIAGTEVLSSTQLTVANINAIGISTLGITSSTNLTSQQLNVSGITTLGITSATNLTSRQLNVSGISTIQSTTLIGGGTSTGTAGQVLQVAGINSSVYIGGNLGIGTTNPTSKLYVVGDGYFTGIVTASNFYVGNSLVGSGSSFSQLNVSGISTLTTLSVGGTTGINGQYLRSTGTGLIWASFTSLRNNYSYTSTEGQKQFVASGINTGYVDVFLNGIRLDETNYSITGTGVSLGVGAYDQDELTIVGFNTLNAGGASSQTLDQTLSFGNSSSLGMSVGIITATSINFASGGLLGDPYGDGGTGLKASATGTQYATVASNNLQQYIQVDNTTTYIGTGYGSTTGTYDWQFKKDGSTKFPNNLILAPTGQNITLQSDQYSQLFWMNADQTVGPDKFTNVDFFVAAGYAVLDIGYRDGASNQQFKSWVWNINGLQFPDSTVQSTAFTGYADNAGIATVAQELTGTPNISVGVITATDYRIQSVAEKTTIVGLNTANLVYNTGGGNVAICTNPSGDITLNVTGIPTDSSFDNYSLAFSVIVTNTGTARSCTAINLNGLSRTIKWFGGSLSAAISGVTTSNGYDVYSFTGINTVGSASTTANYIVLGSVNGSYR